MPKHSWGLILQNNFHRKVILNKNSNWNLVNLSGSINKSFIGQQSHDRSLYRAKLLVKSSR